MHCVICKGALSGVLHCKGCSVQISCCSEECARANWSRSHQYECGQKIGLTTPTLFDKRVSPSEIPTFSKTSQSIPDVADILIEMYQKLSDYKDMTTEEIQEFLTLSNNDTSLFPSVVQFREQLHIQNVVYDALKTYLMNVQGMSLEKSNKIIQDLHKWCILIQAKTEKVIERKEYTYGIEDDAETILLQDILTNCGIERDTSEVSEDEITFTHHVHEHYIIAKHILTYRVDHMKYEKRDQYVLACGFKPDPNFEGTEFEIQQRIDLGVMDKPDWWDTRYDELLVILGKKTGPAAFPYQPVSIKDLGTDNILGLAPTDIRARLTMLFTLVNNIYFFLDQKSSDQYEFIGVKEKKKDEHTEKGCFERAMNSLIHAAFTTRDRSDTQRWVSFFGFCIGVASLLGLAPLSYKVVTHDLQGEKYVGQGNLAADKYIEIQTQKFLDLENSFLSTQGAQSSTLEINATLQQINDFFQQIMKGPEIEFPILLETETIRLQRLNEIIFKISDCANVQCNITNLVGILDGQVKDFGNYLDLKIDIIQRRIADYQHKIDSSSSNPEIRNYKSRIAYLESHIVPYRHLFNIVKTFNRQDQVSMDDVKSTILEYIDTHPTFFLKPKYTAGFMQALEEHVKLLKKHGPDIKSITEELRKANADREVIAMKKMWQAQNIEYPKGSEGMVSTFSNFVMGATRSNVPVRMQDVENKPWNDILFTATPNLIVNILHSAIMLPGALYISPLERQKNLNIILERGPSFFNVALYDSHIIPRSCHLVLNYSSLITVVHYLIASKATSYQERRILKYRQYINERKQQLGQFDINNIDPRILKVDWDRALADSEFENEAFWNSAARGLRSAGIIATTTNIIYTLLAYRQHIDWSVIFNTNDLTEMITPSRLVTIAFIYLLYKYRYANNIRVATCFWNAIQFVSDKCSMCCTNRLQLKAEEEQREESRLKLLAPNVINYEEEERRKQETLQELMVHPLVRLPNERAQHILLRVNLVYQIIMLILMFLRFVKVINNKMPTK